MNRIATIVIALALAGCTYSRTAPDEYSKAQQIVDYGFSRALGKSSYDKMWERIQFGENVKYLNPRAAGVDYCFDCDMRKRGVPEATLRQWHEVVVDQLTSSDLYMDEYFDVTHTFGEMADGGGGSMWARFRERVIVALTAREDFRRYTFADDYHWGPLPQPLPALGPYPDLWPSEVFEHAYPRVGRIGGIEAVDMALINVLIHARRCLTGYDGCH